MNLGSAAGIERLRALGADRFDPVGWHFIEVLSRRAAHSAGGVRALLEHRLDIALARYEQRYEDALEAAGARLAAGALRFPQAAEALQACFERGDLPALARALVRLEAMRGSDALASLLSLLAQAANDGAHRLASAAGVPAGGPGGELKAVRYFRDTWSRLGVEQLMSQAVAQAPENAGPLNSHYLILQALGVMRNVAPDYLARFVSYADALLWLEQVDNGRNPAQKAASGSEREKRPRAARGKAR